MGVKSTVRLTREEAIEKAVELFTEVHRRKIASQFFIMSNEELAEKLMEMNDEAKGGEGFENYMVMYD